MKRMRRKKNRIKPKRFTSGSVYLENVRSLIKAEVLMEDEVLVTAKEAREAREARETREAREAKSAEK